MIFLEKLPQLLPLLLLLQQLQVVQPLLLNQHLLLPAQLDLPQPQLLLQVLLPVAQHLLPDRQAHLLLRHLKVLQQRNLLLPVQPQPLKVLLLLNPPQHQVLRLHLQPPKVLQQPNQQAQVPLQLHPVLAQPLLARVPQLHRAHQPRFQPALLLQVVQLLQRNQLVQVLHNQQVRLLQ